ncbi:hypothetical protein [Winogradskyella costae]|uniref:hypothetical protein n=1 Tax=Winogradskyella costae TaxID=2697008 RepID=UPI0015C78480|nr:hypothetical protein [Winogradskyella costae]
MLNTTNYHTNRMFNDEQFKLSKAGVVEVVSKNKTIRPEKDDEIILLGYQNNKHSNVKADNFVLKYKAKVESVSPAEYAKSSDLNQRERDEKEKALKKGESLIFYNHKINLINKGEFEETPYLEDYTYSLLGIENYKDPQRHFANKITALNKNDFETLYKERIYASRTVLGRLIHALPQENRLEFILIAMEKFNTPELKDITCSIGLRFLNNYLNNHILELGKFLIASKAILENDLLDVIDSSSIGFDNDGFRDRTGLTDKLDVFEESLKMSEINSGDTIIQQAELFEEVLAYSEITQSTIKDILENHQRTSSEIRFNKLFENRRWPINIKI